MFENQSIKAPLSGPLAHLVDVLRPLAGQRVALIAPSGGVKDDRIDTAVALLEAAGVEVHLGVHVRDHHRYLAGTAEARLADLHAAFGQPDVAAVWCLRGGYGSAHLIEHIDYSRIPGSVPLIGFSDITALLEAFRQRGLAAVHGPVAGQLAAPGDTAREQRERVASIASLVDLLQGRVHQWPLTHITGPETPVSGQMVGGNLTTLASLAGTPAALTLERDSILVLEDIGEAEFRLERCFHQLLASVDRSRLKAVCLGHFKHCALAGGQASLTEVLAEWTTADAISIYTGFPLGHGYHNHAWPVNCTASIRQGRLEPVGYRTTCSSSVDRVGGRREND